MIKISAAQEIVTARLSRMSNCLSTKKTTSFQNPHWHKKEYIYIYFPNYCRICKKIFSALVINFYGKKIIIISLIPLSEMIKKIQVYTGENSLQYNLTLHFQADKKPNLATERIKAAVPSRWKTFC